MVQFSSIRQSKILDLLRRHGSINTRELAEMLDVSTMTIHRDLARLHEAGLINKVHGGATLTNPVVEEPPKSDTCLMCGKTITGRTTFMIRSHSGEIQRACCPHCGLHALQPRNGTVAAAMVMDFLNGHVINANQATYLIAPEITICCAPSIIAFSNPDDAIRFQRGFGGLLADLATARLHLHQLTIDNMETIGG